MSNIKFTQVNSLPVQSEKGCVYFVSNGTLHLGKSDGAYLEIGKSVSDVLFVTSLPMDEIEQGKLYVLLSEGKLTIHTFDGTQFIELSPSTHQHEVSDINNLQTILDAKLDSALLTVVSNRLDAHELTSVGDENGIHNIRYFDGKLEYLAEDGWTSIISSNGNTSTIAEITGLQDELDKKVNQTDLDYTLENYYENTAQNIIALFELIDIHEKSLINSGNGLHGIRIWNGKLEEFNSTDSTWNEIISSGVPTEHTHTTDNIVGLTEFVNNMIAGLATGDIELTDASLVAKGIVQLSNETDSEDETKASTPLALKTAIDNIKTIYDKAIENLLIESKEYTDAEITEVKTYVDESVTQTLEESKSYSDTNDLTTLTNAKDYSDAQDVTNLGLAKGYTDSEITRVNVVNDNKYATKLHKHDIEDVNDLQTELDSKAKLTDFNALKTQFTGHKHTIADVDTLQTSLDSKSPLNHNHQWSQITGRPTTSPAQIDALADNQHSHSNLDLLNLFEDGNGTLIYNGNPLGEVAYLSVQTITDRDNIPVDARKEGLMVMVLEDGTMYYLKNGTDNAFWEIFATGSGGATNASTLPATPSGNLTGVNVQSLLDELEAKKANMSDVYTKAETENYMKGYTIDYSTLENLPDLSTLHSHENKETLDLFSQFQGNLTWAGKTLGDLVTEIYDADKNGVIDKAQTLDGMTAKIEEINYLSGVTGNLQSQINAISSGVTFKGEFATYQEMLDNLPTPSKGDLVYIKTDENKDGAVDTQYCFDGTEWVYGGGTTKVPDATITTKGVIQLGGDLSHPNSTASAPKLNSTGVTAGLYRNSNITVSEDGRITHAEEGEVVFLNDTITSTDEGWSSQKISDELAKKAERNHTHAQLHDANKLGSVTLVDETPTDKYAVVYDSVEGKAKWQKQTGGRVMVGSKFIEGDYSLVGGSYITLAIDDITKSITINSTYREGGGNVIATGYEIRESIAVPSNSSVRISAPSTYNKFMLHTVQAFSDSNVTFEVRIYNQSPTEDFAGYIEYNSNPELSISDIVNIPIFDYDNSKMIHFEVVNLGIVDANVTIRCKCTNLL